MAPETAGQWRSHAGGVAGFLSLAVTPPSPRAVANALGTLHSIGALVTVAAPCGGGGDDVDEGVEELTALGRHLALLPIEPQMGKALVLGCLLGCIDPLLTIMALLCRRPPFVAPLHKQAEADRAKRRFADGAFGLP